MLHLFGKLKPFPGIFGIWSRSSGGLYIYIQIKHIGRNMATKLLISKKSWW